MQKRIKRVNYANIITSTRIIGSIVMIIIPPFSILFWVCYLASGVSDMLDGLVARKFNLQSSFGAKLDSLADLLFAAALCIIIVVHVSLPMWIWGGAIIVALIRMMSLWIGFYKYHTFVSLHTYLNKLTGGLLFLFPVLYITIPLNIIGIITCVIALIASMEELILIIRSKFLDRNCKSMVSFNGGRCK